ncbi:MAG: aminoglycoside phosphotransferase family protein [Vitreimonas sp.]
MIFDPYLAKWRLARDGEPICTPSSNLLPVRRDGAPAMLKIAVVEEERRGATVMSYYDGDGAARVLAHEGDALLIERASGGASLIEMARGGADDLASGVICTTIARLHVRRAHRAPPDLVHLRQWFRCLESAARNGGVLARAFVAAQRLLAEPAEAIVLHGDIHHGNILYDKARGWLAIDPKGLLGDRAFDYANIFCNPDFAVATAPGRLQRQAALVSHAADIERERLLEWILAYAGLSASWMLAEGENTELPLAVAEIAAAELGPHPQ